MSDLEQQRIAALERQVAELTEQCASANRELEAIAYAVSHDLRAPLRSLSGFSQALAELPSYGDDTKAQHYLNRIQQASRKMADLIDALLSLSRIARVEMMPRAVDFSRVCLDAFNAVKANHPERTVTIDIAPDMTAYGDARLLRTAMELLIDNAVKFSVARDTSRIAIGQRAEDQAFYVRDNGIGFDMAYADKLFKPFQRLHADPQFAGIGIGLAIVQRIVARHRGRIWAESQHSDVNSGTTVFFLLAGQGTPKAPSS